MPANQKRQPLPSPTSQQPNKNASEFLTSTRTIAVEPSNTSAAMAQMNTKTNAQAPTVPLTMELPVAVNRKKQKRRQKAAEAAAKQAAEHRAHDFPANGFTDESHVHGLQEEYEYEQGDEDRPYCSDEEAEDYTNYYDPNDLLNGYAPMPSGSRSSKKKKRRGTQHDPANRSHLAQAGLDLMPPITMSKEKIWNTSSQEERERIKAFWLSLGEEERRSLVKVEKDAVLKKMKEQQKHSCSCTVCGRKRIAIEEELEVLYDAYYDELEQYAHRQGTGPPPMLSGSQRFGQISGLQPPHRLPPAFDGPRPSRGRITEHFDDQDDEGDEEYSDDLDLEDEEYSDEEVVSQFPQGHAADFFNFGQSLTVKGGILTVADDLLKNDGKKFIEMMEQLAERRMAREEDAKEQYTNGYGHPANGMPPHNHSHGHNHAPVPEDEEEYEEDDEEDEYDSQDEDYEEEEMDTMTEEQRMEEGRRMFQIFAARMFEQRVLSAYKEKVAAERQNKLIQEENEEAIAAEAKKAKKAKDAAKKKEKAQAKKLAQAEEKAKKDAEKAAQEAALREAEAQRIEEQRQKAEEKRRKRDAQKKAEEEERLKKELDKQKRLQDQRERQAEQERKVREAKDRERKEKEEARLKEKEAKEAKERELRERKEQLDRERRDAEKKVKGASREQSKNHEQPPPAVPTQVAKRPTPQAPVPLPLGLQSHHNAPSPQISVAIPIIPKVPSPQTQASLSNKDSASVPQTPQVGSNTSSNTSPHPTTPQQQSSPGPMYPNKNSQPFLHHPQATSPLHSALKASAFAPSPFSGLPPMGLNGFQPGMPIGGGFGSRTQHDPMGHHPQGFGTQFRPLGGPNGMQPFQSMNGIPMPQGRGFPLQHAPPGFSHHVPGNGIGQFGAQPESSPGNLHSRHQSGSFDKSSFESTPPSQPIARPAPIGRPPSTQGHRLGENSSYRHDVDDVSNHLGSSALLDDTDEPFIAGAIGRRASAAPASLSGRQGFAQAVPFGMETPFGAGWSGNSWAAAPGPNAFTTSSLPKSNYMGGWAQQAGFGPLGSNMGRPSQPRSVAVRLMLCAACKSLEGSASDGFNSISIIKDQMERMGGLRDEPISEKDLLDLCETEGNPQNGGGSFDVREDTSGNITIRYQADVPGKWGGGGGIGRPVGPPGEIGSPVVSGRGFHGAPGLTSPSGW